MLGTLALAGVIPAQLWFGILVVVGSAGAGLAVAWLAWTRNPAGLLPLVFALPLLSDQAGLLYVALIGFPVGMLFHAGATRKLALAALSFVVFTALAMLIGDARVAQIGVMLVIACNALLAFAISLTLPDSATAT